VSLPAGIDAISLSRSDPQPRRATGSRATRVSVRGLTKGYAVRRGWWAALRHPFSAPRNIVVDALDLDVFDSEMFGILGLNGAGKTTLLKMLATFILPDEGSASIAGHDIIARPHDVRAHLAMVTADERSLNWRLSADENLLLFAGLHGMNGKQARSLTTRILATVGLQSTGDKIVGTFSSGMRQRLLLARALLSNPRILLLDEPTRSLDPVAAHDFRRLLRDLADQSGVTILLATHNPDEAFNYCDRVAILHRGSIAALGRASELATRFGRERHRIWTHNREHPCFSALVRRGLIAELTPVADVDGGSGVECTITGGEAQAADVLRRLVESRVGVTRFERVALPLSTLIARIVEAHSTGAHKGPSHA
jgi:ABC-2 type transport system ATP-binding protein